MKKSNLASYDQCFGFYWQNASQDNLDEGMIPFNSIYMSYILETFFNAFLLLYCKDNIAPKSDLFRNAYLSQNVQKLPRMLVIIEMSSARFLKGKSKTEFLFSSS